MKMRHEQAWHKNTDLSFSGGEGWWRPVGRGRAEHLMRPCNLRRRLGWVCLYFPQEMYLSHR